MSKHTTSMHLWSGYMLLFWPSSQARL